MQDPFTPEVEKDCHEQSKIQNPQTTEEIEYNQLLDKKIEKCWKN